MKRTISLCVIVLFAICACSKDNQSNVSDSAGGEGKKAKGKYSDAIIIMEEFTKIQESYLDNLGKVQSADDLVKVINAYSDSMTGIMPRIIDMTKKYPELDQSNDKDLKRIEERIEVLGKRIEQETPAVLIKYQSDPKVQESFMKMAASMSGIEEGQQPEQDAQEE